MVTIDAAVLAAANRIMHMDYPDDLTQEQRIRAFELDAQLLAGAVALAATERSS